jgi:hypothetical protein
VKYATRSGKSFTPPSVSVTEEQVNEALNTAKAGRASPAQPSLGLRLEVQQLPPECADCLKLLGQLLGHKEREVSCWCPNCDAQLCYRCFLEHVKAGCNCVELKLKKQVKSICAQQRREKRRKA